MKNANIFFTFIFSILLIYPVSIYSYNKSKKIDLSTVPVYVYNFSYKIIDEKEEIFIKGDSLLKQLDKHIVQKPQGYYVSKDKRVEFRADLATNHLIEDKIELNNSIKIAEKNNQIETDRIIFVRNNGTIYAPEHIKIIFDSSILEGRDLIYDLNSKKIILKNIRGKLWLSKIF